MGGKHHSQEKQGGFSWSSVCSLSTALQEERTPNGKDAEEERKKKLFLRQKTPRISKYLGTITHLED